MGTAHATWTSFISIQTLQLCFHKYHRTPYVVAGSVPSQTVTTTCAKKKGLETFSKHSAE